MDRRETAMAANRARVQDAVVHLAGRRRLADITLADVSELADVSVRTLLRYFGTRDELLRAVADDIEAEPIHVRTPTPGDVEASLTALGDDYDGPGVTMLSLLEQERTDEIAALITTRGKAMHRRWVCEAFGLDPEADEEQIDLLVVVTDLYTWKLLRHDRGLSREQAIARMARLVRAVRASFDGTQDATLTARAEPTGEHNR
jgi:AcrR family transcriptional regulator